MHDSTFVHRLSVFGDQSVRVGLVDYAFAHEAFRISLSGGGYIAYHPIHCGLGYCRLVRFVVSETAVADDVDNHILVERHSEVIRQRYRKEDGIGVVAIHMKDGRLHHLGDLGAVGCRARVQRVAGGESYLVVDDHMDGAAGGKPTGVGHVEGFHHHALTRKSGIAVNQNGHDEVLVVVTATILTSTNRSLNHGINNFKMRWIKGQRNMDDPAGGTDVR